MTHSASCLAARAKSPLEDLCVCGLGSTGPEALLTLYGREIRASCAIPRDVVVDMAVLTGNRRDPILVSPEVLVIMRAKGGVL